MFGGPLGAVGGPLGAIATGGPLGADGGPRPIGLDQGAVLKGSPNGVESPSSSSIFLFERSYFNIVTFFF